MFYETCMKYEAMQCSGPVRCLKIIQTRARDLLREKKKSYPSIENHWLKLLPS